MKIKTISALRKIMTMKEYSNFNGTPNKEYEFEELPVRIVRSGSQRAFEKGKPYTVHHKRIGKNFKTLVECLEYILSERYIYDSKMNERCIRDSSFHYNVN